MGSNNALDQARGQQHHKGQQDVAVQNKVASISGGEAARRSTRTLNLLGLLLQWKMQRLRDK